MNWLKHKQGLCRLHILSSALIAFILGISYGCGECAYSTERLGRREGRCLAMFVCGVVRFHTDGGLVSVSLHSSSYQESNVPKTMSCLTLAASC